MLIKTKQQRQKLSQMLVTRYISIFKRLFDCKVSADGKRQSYVYVEPNEHICMDVWFNEDEVVYELRKIPHYDRICVGTIKYKKMLSETIDSVVSILLKQKEEYEKSNSIQESSC